MAYCPFLSTFVSEAMEFVECITTDCQLWDPENNRCGLVTSDYARNNYIVNNTTLSRVDRKSVV